MRADRTALVTALVLGVTAAGCLSTGLGTPTATPLPAGSVEFPSGPKEPPDRPANLNRSSVRQYVKTFEYRLAYNRLWVNEYTEVTLDCHVASVSERPWGYEAVVSCTGHSNTNVPEDATVTRGPHYDWFTQEFLYRVSEETTHRSQLENRETTT